MGSNRVFPVAVLALPVTQEQEQQQPWNQRVEPFRSQEVEIIQDVLQERIVHAAPARFSRGFGMTLILLCNQLVSTGWNTHTAKLMIKAKASGYQ